MKTKKRISTLLVVLIVILTPLCSYAVTVAYVIGYDGEVLKVNTEDNSYEVLKLAVPLDKKLDFVLGIDVVHKNIIISHCKPHEICTVGVYDLQTLKYFKDLPINANDPEVRLLLFPDYSKFLVQYYILDQGTGIGGYATYLYDASSLSAIQNLKTFFPLKDATFSANGSKIFSIIGGDNAKTYIVNSVSLETEEVLSLNQLWLNDVFSAGVVEGADYGKIVIYENQQAVRFLGAKMDYRVYDIESRSLSQKISTGLQGDVKLIADGKKLVFNETEDVRETIRSKSYLKGFRSVGRLHIYDVETANRLMTISYEPYGSAEVIGIRPQGDKIYLRQEKLDEIGVKSKVMIIDLGTKAIAKTIDIPFRANFMSFVAE